MSRKTQYYALTGGINTESPALSVPPGQLLDALNYEQVTEGGYRRVDGFERFDGRILPSDVIYYTMPFDTGSHEVQIGDHIIGSTSIAHADVVDVVVESGSWVGGDAVGYFVFIYAQEGGIDPEFISGEVIIVSIPEAFSSGYSSGFR